MTNGRTYSTIHAADMARVPVHDLTRWAKYGYVHPTKEGKTYRWTAPDIDRAELLGALTRVLGPYAVAQFAKALEIDGPTFHVHDGPYVVTVSVALCPNPMTKDPTHAC